MKRFFQCFLSGILLIFCVMTPYAHREYYNFDYLSSSEFPIISPSRFANCPPIRFDENKYIPTKKVFIPEYRFPEMQQQHVDFCSSDISYPPFETSRLNVRVGARCCEQRQPNTWEPSEQFLEKATVEQFWYALCRMYGSQIHSHHIDILKTLKWYRYNSFIEIIKTFPEYRTFILALEKQLHEVFFKRVQIWWHGAKEKILLLKREIVAQKLKEEQEEREIQERERRRSAHIAKINSVLSSERSNLVSLCNEYKTICENDFVTDQQRARYKNRTHVIEQFLQQSSQLYDASYEVTNGAIELLTEYGFSKNDSAELKHCFGNKLQQVAHEECVDALNQFTRKYKIISMPYANNLMTDSATIGSRLAKSGYIAQAFSCADLCYTVLDLGCAVLEGGYDSALNILNTVMHPIETIENTAYGLATIIYQANKTLHDLEIMGINYCIDPQTAKKQWQGYCDGAEQLYNAMAAQIQDLTVHDAVRKTTSIVIDLFLMKKILSSAHKMCRTAKGNLVELVKSMEVTETVTVTAEGIEIRVATNPNVQKFSAAAREIVVDSRKVIESFHANFMQNIKQEVTTLRKLFDNTVKGFAEFSNKYIKIDYEHIFGMELRFSKKGLLQISGFHHDLKNAIEKSGLIEFANKIITKSGFYEVTLFHEGNVAKKVATFFPAHWSREKVISKIHEAYNNFLKSGEKAIPKDGGKYVIRGLIEEGIKIEMYITANGVITTAYPILL